MNLLKSVWALVKREPVVISHVAAAVLSLLAAFGFGLDAKTAASVMTGVQAVVAFITRNFTSPATPAQ